MVFHCTSPFCLLITCRTLWRPFPVLSTLVSCIQPVVWQHLRVFSAQLSSTLLCCSSCWCEQGSATGEPLFKLGVCQVRAWLSSILQLGAVCALPEGTFSAACQAAAAAEAKQCWLQCWPWEMLLIAGLPVKLQVVELSLNLTMTWSQFSNPFLNVL